MLNFQNKDNEKIQIDSIKHKAYCKRVIKPTDEEIRLHKDYLKNVP